MKTIILLTQYDIEYMYRSLVTQKKKNCHLETQLESIPYKFSNLKPCMIAPGRLFASKMEKENIRNAHLNQSCLEQIDIYRLINLHDNYNNSILYLLARDMSTISCLAIAIIFFGKNHFEIQK